MDIRFKIAFLLIILIIAGAGFLAYCDDCFEVKTVITKPKVVLPPSPPEKIISVLDVPFVSEAPENIWKGSWVNACEEASIMMVDEYYKGNISVSTSTAKTYLSNLFTVQKKLYGSDANSDSVRIKKMIDENTEFKAEIVINPTIEDIKNEIKAGRPIISLHRGFDLKNPNIPFLPTGSSYHTVVVVGYDDLNKSFVVHDPGDQYSGANYTYTYSD